MKWYICIKSDEGMKKLLKNIGMKHVKTVDRMFHVVVAKTTGRKIAKCLGKMNKLGYYPILFDDRTYEEMRSMYQSLTETGNRNNTKEADDGKTLSARFGMGAEAPCGEEDGIRVDTDGEAGGEDGYLPDADPGRPDSTGEERRELPVQMGYMTYRDPLKFSNALHEVEDWIKAQRATWTDNFQVLPRLVCYDGFSVSVQHSSHHYCSPRIDFAEREGLPFVSYELGYPSDEEPDLLEYAENRETPLSTVYAFVPASLVEWIVDQHDGISDYVDPASITASSMRER